MGTSVGPFRAGWTPQPESVAALHLEPPRIAVLLTRVLTTEAEFDSIRSDWDDLLESSNQAVFFLRWHWNRTWWRWYAPPESRLALVTCRDGDGRLVGLAPFYWQTRWHFGFFPLREFCLLGTGVWMNTSEYADIVARRGAEAAVSTAVAGWLRTQKRWDRLWLWGVPATSNVLRQFRVALGPRARTWACDHAPGLDTSGDWPTTQHCFAHDVERQLRQVFSEPRALAVRVQHPDELKSALDDLVRLHELRWRAKGQPGSFAYPPFEDFLRDVARGAIEHGRLGLWRLMIEDRCVAVLIAFVDFETVHYFQSGFEPSSPHSLGRVIVGLAIRDAVTAGSIKWFDFMGGHADYKQEWTSAGRETIELELFSAGIRAGLFRVLRAVRRQLGRIRRAYRSYFARRAPAGSTGVTLAGR